MLQQLMWHSYRGATKAAMVVSAALPGGAHRCPLCGHQGHFAPVFAQTGRRRHAKCPRCGALERHRLQVPALRDLTPLLDSGARRVLHVAPERVLRPALSAWALEYTTADTALDGVDLQIDLRSMPTVADGSFDLIWASHVLEHIDRDHDAIAEIHRVLAPGGCAVLPVPIVADHTVEYPAPSPYEEFHVRAPGPDYFERYERVFARVDLVRSGSTPDEVQAWTLKSRRHFPTRWAPLRPPQAGDRHEDIVPICWK